jgi:hypothetical protein
MPAHTVSATRPVSATRHATLGWALPLVVAGIALTAAAKLWAGPLALPLLSMLLIGAGFVVAGALLLLGSRIGKDRNGAWMAAGALVFLGFAAALLSDGPEALAQLDRMQAHGIASAAN